MNNKLKKRMKRENNNIIQIVNNNKFLIRLVNQYVEKDLELDNLRYRKD